MIVPPDVLIQETVRNPHLRFTTEFAPFATKRHSSRLKPGRVKRVTGDK